MPRVVMEYASSISICKIRLTYNSAVKGMDSVVLRPAPKNQLGRQNRLVTLGNYIAQLLPQLKSTRSRQSPEIAC